MLNPAEKEALYKKADKRLKERGAPYFGVCEKDLLVLKNNFEHFNKVWSSHMETANRNFTLLQAVPKEVGVLQERVGNQEFHNTALMNLLHDKGLIKAEELQTYVDEVTFSSFGLLKTGAPAVQGDTVILGFRLECDGEVIDDKEAAKMAYLVGSADMPIDEHIEGAQPGQHKAVEFVWPENKPFEGVEGKPVIMHLWVKDVRRVAKKSADEKASA